MIHFLRVYINQFNLVDSTKFLRVHQNSYIFFWSSYFTLGKTRNYRLRLKFWQCHSHDFIGVVFIKRLLTSLKSKKSNTLKCVYNGVENFVLKLKILYFEMLHEIHFTITFSWKYVIQDTSV